MWWCNHIGLRGGAAGRGRKDRKRHGVRRNPRAHHAQRHQDQQCDALQNYRGFQSGYNEIMSFFEQQFKEFEERIQKQTKEIDELEEELSVMALSAEMHK